MAACQGKAVRFRVKPDPTVFSRCHVEAATRFFFHQFASRLRQKRGDANMSCDRPG